MKRRVLINIQSFIKQWLWRLSSKNCYCQKNSIYRYHLDKMIDFQILPLVQVKADGSAIDLQKIAEICNNGLGECPPEDRFFAWLSLIGIFPSNPEIWPEKVEEMTKNYAGFVNDQNMIDYDQKIIENLTGIMEFGVNDNHLMSLIHGDVARTGHHIIHFPNPDLDAKPTCEDDNLHPFHEHMRRIERILYIFAKCNPSMSYMQGFNEIVSVFYYVFSSAIIIFNYKWFKMEAVLFFTFQRIFAETGIADFYTTQDNSSLIHRRMAAFEKMVKNHLPNASKTISDLNIHPLLYSFRWTNLLFSQDHDIPELLLIWDTLFAHYGNLIEFGNYIGIAQISVLQELFIKGDYAQTMTVLQKLKISDPTPILRLANHFWNEDHPKQVLLYK